MGLVNNFDVDTNFFEQFPEFKVAGPFKEVYASDKTRGKNRSSKIAWCIVLIWDSASKFYNLPEFGEDGKVQMVFEDYLGDKKYYEENKSTVLEMKELYLKMQETPAMRYLRTLEEKMLERDNFLKNTEYTMGVIGERGTWVGNTVDTVDKMLANTSKIYELLGKAKEAVDKESQLDAVARGGAEESLSDKGNI
jgi:hypothetical protein